LEILPKKYVSIPHRKVAGGIRREEPDPDRQVSIPHRKVAGWNFIRAND